MSNTEDLKPYIDQLKGRLEEYVIRRVPSYKPGKNFRCLNPAHDDHNPSMSFSRKTNTCRCFSEQKTYDILDLLALEYGKSCHDPKEFVEIVRQGCAEFGIYIPEKSASSSNKPVKGEEYLSACHACLEETGYFRKRGISDATARRFRLGFDSHYPLGNNRYMQAAIIPTGTTSFTARNTYPFAESDERYRKYGNTRTNFLNIEALNKDEPVFITEGELDALSIIECGFESIALGSVANCQNFVQLCKDKNFRQYIIIALDNDTAGMEASAKLLLELKASGIKAVAVNPYMGCKDANEALMKSPVELKARLQEEIATLKAKEQQSIKLKTILEAVMEFSEDQWEHITECLSIIKNLPEDKQRQIYEYIKGK